jgi:hypothetical protein
MRSSLLVVTVGLMPSLLSVWVMRKSQAQTRAKLRAAMSAPAVRQRRSPSPSSPDRYYLEGVGFLIGDISCQFNSRSASGVQSIRRDRVKVAATTIRTR